jgi:hypothetical protein
MLPLIDMLRFRVDDARAALAAAQEARLALNSPDGIYLFYSEQDRIDHYAVRNAADAACLQAAMVVVDLEAKLAHEEAKEAWAARLEAIRAASEAACRALQEESERFMAAATVTANNAVNTLPPSVDGATRDHLVRLLRYRLLMSRREPAATRVLVRGLPAVACGCIPTAEVAGGSA